MNPKNTALKNDFLAYLKSIQRASGTIIGYGNDLDIVNVFILTRCGNKDFVSVKKREFAALQSWLIDEHGNSPARVRRVKAAISSLSNYITNILADDEPEEFGDYRPSIRAIENPVNTTVREKLVLTDEQCDETLRRLVESKKYEQACYLALALSSGRRKSELLRFKVKYFGDDHLICNGALYSTIETIRTKGRGTQGKQLVCYTLAKTFKPYFDLWMQERERLGIESEWLFPDRKNPTVARNVSVTDTWAALFGRILTDIAGERVDYYNHSSRHYLATHLAKCGVPQNVIQSFFGWASLDLVGVYTDIDASESFGDYFTPDGIVGGKTASLSDL